MNLVYYFFGGHGVFLHYKTTTTLVFGYWPIFQSYSELGRMGVLAIPGT